MSPLSNPLRANPSHPLALVLSGGGARGAFQVGVYEMLLSHDRGLEAPPEIVSGTSAGAINAALIASNLTPKEMLSFWLELAHDPPVRANVRLFESAFRVIRRLARQEPGRSATLRSRELHLLRFGLKKYRWYRPAEAMAMLLEFVMTARFDNVSELLAHLDTSYLFDVSPFAAHLERAIGGKVLRSRTRVAINTVAARTGKVMRIVNYPTDKRADATHYVYAPEISLEMIVASAAIPLLFNPVNVGGEELWDGGLLVNTPLAPAVALGARRLIPLLVTAEASSLKRMLTLGAAFERVADIFLENAYNIDRKLLLERNRLAVLAPQLGLSEVTLFNPIRPEPGYLFDAGSYLYFEPNAMRGMYEAGRRAARRWLEEGVLTDRAKDLKGASGRAEGWPTPPR